MRGERERRVAGGGINIDMRNKGKEKGWNTGQWGGYDIHVSGGQKGGEGFGREVIGEVLLCSKKKRAMSGGAVSEEKREIQIQKGFAEKKAPLNESKGRMPNSLEKRKGGDKCLSVKKKNGEVEKGVKRIVDKMQKVTGFPGKREARGHRPRKTIKMKGGAWQRRGPNILKKSDTISHRGEFI